MFDDVQGADAPKDLIIGQQAREAMNQLDRRDLLKLGLVGILGSVVPLMPAGTAMASNYGAHRINFRQAHTGDGFNGVYRNISFVYSFL